MNNRVKTILSLFAFAVLLAGATFAYNALRKTVSPENQLTAETGQVPENGESPEEEPVAAPDFTVLDADGNAVKLSELVGKPMVLNFWASWCSPCKSEMPDFNTVYEELGDEITFVMVDMVDGRRETVETGKAHIADNAFTFPVYYDTEQDAAMVYGVTSLPTTYFIDKDGYVVTGARGGIDEKTLRDGIALIAEDNAS